MVLCVALGAYIEIVSLQAALHPQMHSGRWLIGGIFVFLGLLGNVLGKVRRNFCAVALGAPPALCFAGLLLALLVPAVYSLVLSKRRELDRPADSGRG
jgi:hypothetical protein